MDIYKLIKQDKSNTKLGSKRLVFNCLVRNYETLTQYSILAQPFNFHSHQCQYQSYFQSTITPMANESNNTNPPKSKSETKHIRIIKVNIITPTPFAVTYVLGVNISNFISIVV